MTCKHITIRFGGWLLACLLIGCGGATERKAAGSAEKQRRLPDVSAAAARPDKTKLGPPERPAAERDQPEPRRSLRKRSDEPKPKRRSLADLLGEPADAAPRLLPDLPRLKVDEAKAAAEGIRKLPGKRVTLYTDMPASREIDILPELVDQAFPQWCEYFGLKPSSHSDWHLTGFLMKEKARFVHAGLLPDDLPPFQHGYARNHEFWLYDQPSDYYRRHLLLHECTHCFMNTLLGACGPPWYMEGLAELLGTHRWADGRLTLNHMPANREEVAMWGRIKIVKDARTAGKAKTLKQVIEVPASAHLETAPYGWCWAAAALMDRHPGYRKRFRAMQKHVLRSDFNDLFFQLIGEDWGNLAEQWQVFVAELEYGHDVAKTTIDFTPGKPLPAGGASVTVLADRGWQNSHVRLESGKTYRLRASGRYQVADKPRAWLSEPGGVSIRYYRGQPLGILLATVHPDRTDQDASPFIRPVVVGLQAELTPDRSGTLFLKINDSAAELGDNAGELTVKVDRD